MTIDNLGLLSGDRYVGQDGNHKARAGCRAIDRGNDRLVAVDDVVDEILGFFPRLHDLVRVANHVFDQAKITTGGKRLARTGHDDRVDVGVAVDVDPHVRHLGVGFGIDRVECLGPVERDAQDAIRRVVKFQFIVFCITIRHGSISSVGY